MPRKAKPPDGATSNLPAAMVQPRTMISPPAPVPGPAEWQAMREMAATLAKTEFVPSGLQHRPDAVLAAIMKGRELGIGPMQALSQINVIKGRPTMSAELMMALIRRAGHSIQITESSNEAVTVTARRADTHDTHTETFDVDRAKQAGLLDKDNWKTYRQAMLRARAISATGRFLFPDVLLGVSYVPEELENGGEVPVVVEAVPSPPATPDITDPQRKALTTLGNSLERRWPPGKYRARYDALGGDFQALFNELVAEHVATHGTEDSEHIAAAKAILEGEASE